MILSVLRLLTLSVILSACGVSSTIESNQELSLIAKWEWTSSSFVTRGMSEPRVSSPESRGYTIELDIKESEIGIFKNGNHVADVPYRLEIRDDDKSMIWVEIPQDDFPFFIASGPIYISKEQLTISGGYNDAGENQTFKRIN